MCKTNFYKSKGNLYCVKDYSYIRIPVPNGNAKMLLLRFPNSLFPGFCQFCMEKKVVIEVKTLYDFPYFLMHIRFIDVIFNYNTTTYLVFTCLKSRIKH